jgi:hypothetical protein
MKQAVGRAQPWLARIQQTSHDVGDNVAEIASLNDDVGHALMRRRSARFALAVVIAPRSS